MAAVAPARRPSSTCPSFTRSTRQLQVLAACATGQHLKEATITHRKAGKGQQEFLVVKLNDVLVSSVVHGGDTSGPASETVSLVFAKVDFETARRRLTDRSMPGFTSSSTSRPTNRARPASRRAHGALRTGNAGIDARRSDLGRNSSSEEPAVYRGRGTYRRVLEASPDHPRALHYAGVLAHQRGRNDEAIGSIGRSLALVPDEADWHSNLGIVQRRPTSSILRSHQQARDRPRSGAHERSQQSRRPAAGDRTGGRAEVPIARPSGSILPMSTRTPTSASC